MSTNTPKAKRQRMGTVVLFQSKDRPYSYHGMIELEHDLPKGQAFDVQIYSEVSEKGTGYLKGPIYLKPVTAPHDETTPSLH